MLRKHGYSPAELLTILSARQLSDGQVVFAGVGIPLLAATLAQRLRCPGLTILFEGGVIGAFIEPGKAQVDQYGNLNSSFIGDPARPKTRLPGTGGGNDIASLAHMIVAMKHEKRRFVEHVDFVTSPGYLRGGDTRRASGLLAGGTFRVVTDLAVFGFETDKRRMQVMSLNPGVTREELQDNTGFALAFAPHLGVTEPPTDQELALLHELDPDRLYTG
jgi:glutaconate CoA-transferase subunit B